VSVNPFLLKCQVASLHINGRVLTKMALLLPLATGKLRLTHTRSLPRLLRIPPFLCPSGDVLALPLKVAGAFILGNWLNYRTTASTVSRIRIVTPKASPSDSR
jgi:hypothetical protein